MIDHVFMLVQADGPEIEQMGRLGLVETYRRVHPGQGTRNVCYCFDNMFLELLWIEDPEEACRPQIRRTGLFERSLWRTAGTCPFGIAWRGTPFCDVATWAYRPPYLPEGMPISVAVDSDDRQQPMIFQSPGAAPPIQWPAERRGQLQHGRGLGAIREMALKLPYACRPSRALRAIASACQPALRLDYGTSYGLQLIAAGLSGKADTAIRLPVET